MCGYWQVELHPQSRLYVAFIFEGRNYQFKRLPFGLVNSVAIFVACMDQILGQEALQFTTVYVDDLLITSETWEEHCYRVEHVLEKLAKNNITLKLEKSKFIAREVQFLGFNLDDQGISPVSYTHLVNISSQLVLSIAVTLPARLVYSRGISAIINVIVSLCTLCSVCVVMCIRV